MSSGVMAPVVAGPVNLSGSGLGSSVAEGPDVGRRTGTCCPRFGASCAAAVERATTDRTANVTTRMREWEVGRDQGSPRVKLGGPDARMNLPPGRGGRD